MAPSGNLQIPLDDGDAAGPSRAQYASANSSASRPVSVAVQSASNPTPPSASRRQRASHQVVSPSSSSQNPGANGRGPEESSQYTDVMSHPAVVAYAAAHPRRTIPRFGPYLLLQTLGEGEFGKVKLGLHSSWGEEVAVKLIRRGNVDTAVRMSKVEREIEVLRTLKHPNIVRLYDVIETDKYIGIIIEYASGGELFDHILAHRYLREKDAAKLFSQLISGVWYIHQKKIVHRDLKLENLLLDRHRNVIITDFGFANRFEHKTDDLMQTSCGSPCYAAPELVISEGSYVGSAVDIWSCGVILYAMLAGYLPFDDDPANPDGDNINLLYKYIVNTPLTFPEYVSDSARDLLRMMLVPDPSKRSGLQAVMRHPWLAGYQHEALDPLGPEPYAFGRTVAELEKAALEQHQQKRQAYQKMMKQAAAPQQSSRSRSERQDPNTGNTSAPLVHANTTTATTRSRSTQPEYLYDSSVADNSAVSAPGGFDASYTNEDDPFAAPGTTAPGNLTIDGEPGARSAHTRRDARHTIQVEYDEPRPTRGDPREREPSDGAREATPKKQKTRSRSRGPQDSPGTTRNKQRAGSEGPKALPTPPDVFDEVNRTPSRRTPRQGSVPNTPTGRDRPPIPVPLIDPASIVLAEQTAAFPTSEEPSMVVETPTQEKDSVSQSSSRESKHRRGLSGMGNGLTKLFGGAAADTEPASNTSSMLSPAEKEKTPGKKSRRNTLTAIAGTIKNRTQRSRMSTTPVEPPAPMPDREGDAGLSSGPSSYSHASRPDIDGSDASNSASTARAKGVMHWFRSKSRTRDSSGVIDNSVSTPSYAEQRGERGRQQDRSQQSAAAMQPIHVTVLPTPTPTSSKQNRSSRVPSTPTEPGVMSGLANRFRNSVTVGGSSSAAKAKAQVASGGPPAPFSAMRVHHGAVDQTMITTRPPPEVMSQIRQLLLEMGIEVQDETEFKYRCIRAKRRKTAGGNVAAFTMVGSAGSNGVDKRGLPVPSNHPSFSAPTGMLRGLLMRRQSSQISSGVTEDEITPGSSVAGDTPNFIEPIFGDASEDVGDECRFSVELTKIDRLSETYSLDIRRLKGNLRSYKFLYDTIRVRCDLR